MRRHLAPTFAKLAAAVAAGLLVSAPVGAHAASAQAGQEVSAQPAFTTEWATVSSNSIYNVIVHLTAAPGLPAPTGAVNFSLAGSPLAGCESVVPDPGGNAICTATSPIQVANYTIGASYSGDDNYRAEPVPGLYTLTVSSSARDSGFISLYDRKPDNFELVTEQHFTVVGQMEYLDTSDPWSGTVAFQANSSPISGCQSVAVDTGFLPTKPGGLHTRALSVTCATALPVGKYVITASYSGDAARNPGISSLTTILVVKADTAITVSSTPANAAPGQTVTFTVTVQGSAPGGTTPITGVNPTAPVTITYNGGGGGSCTVHLAGGSGSCSMPAPSSPGTYTVTVQYPSDDPQFNPSQTTHSLTVVRASAGGPGGGNSANGGWILPLINAAGYGWPFVAVLLIVIFFLFWRRRRRRKNKDGEEAGAVTLDGPGDDPLAQL